MICTWSDPFSLLYYRIKQLFNPLECTWLNHNFIFTHEQRVHVTFDWNCVISVTAHELLGFTLICLFDNRIKGFWSLTSFRLLTNTTTPAAASAVLMLCERHTHTNEDNFDRFPPGRHACILGDNWESASTLAHPSSCKLGDKALPTRTNVRWSSANCEIADTMFPRFLRSSSPSLPPQDSGMLLLHDLPDPPMWEGTSGAGGIGCVKSPPCGPVWLWQDGSLKWDRNKCANHAQPQVLCCKGENICCCMFFLFVFFYARRSWRSHERKHARLTAQLDLDNFIRCKICQRTKDQPDNRTAVWPHLSRSTHVTENNFQKIPVAATTRSRLNMFGNRHQCGMTTDCMTDAPELSSCKLWSHEATWRRMTPPLPQIGQWEMRGRVVLLAAIKEFNPWTEIMEIRSTHGSGRGK